jgi:uncharacterized protein (TIGR02118 family)
LHNIGSEFLVPYRGRVLDFAAGGDILKDINKIQEGKMAEVKFIVIYPRPADIEAFEKLYQQEHVPMAVEKLVGKTKFVATKIIGTPQGTPPFYRIAEVYFPSIDALNACAATEGAKETLAHAVDRKSVV